jgi:hypothetical protein
MSNKLFSQTVRVDQLNSAQINRMFAIFSKYYSNTGEEVFKKDLLKKNVVFLLIDRRQQEIQGFSTLVNLNVEVEGRRVRGVFSGDTIIEKEFWGQGTLGVAFLKHLFLEKLKRPFSPLYWFLISKGFKTYLLMANNFSEHYPRHEQATPKREKGILAAFSKTLYPEHFREDLGLVVFDEDAGKDALKSEVAPITEQMRQENQRIAFFEKQNPEWHRGDELCCIARMDLSMPLTYQLKVIKKGMNRGIELAIARLGLLFGMR